MPVSGAAHRAADRLRIFRLVVSLLLERAALDQGLAHDLHVLRAGILDGAPVVAAVAAEHVHHGLHAGRRRAGDGVHGLADDVDAQLHLRSLVPLAGFGVLDHLYRLVAEDQGDEAEAALGAEEHGGQGPELLAADDVEVLVGVEADVLLKVVEVRGGLLVGDDVLERL